MTPTPRTDLNTSLPGDHHIPPLEVPVHHLARVEVLQAEEDLAGVAAGDVLRQGAELLDERSNRAAGDELGEKDRDKKRN